MKALKPKEFVCPVCKHVRERGSFVRVGRGRFSGVIVKVCKSALCKALARR